MNKNLMIAVFLIILAGGVYYWYGHRQALSMQPANEYTELTPTNDTAQTPPADSVGKHSVTWKFENVGQSKTSDAQITKVTVVWDGVSHDGGVYEGTCAEIDGSNGTLSDGEVSGALCWYAGAGDEIGVFNENGKFVLKHGEQQEPSGEGQGFRGNFTTLLSL